MMKMNIRRDDTVVVLSGKDKGKQGKILEAMPESRKVIVEKVNVATRHTNTAVRAGDKLAGKEDGGHAEQ